jgi:hypothetical protein
MTEQEEQREARFLAVCISSAWAACDNEPSRVAGWVNRAQIRLDAYLVAHPGFQLWPGVTS